MMFEAKLPSGICWINTEHILYALPVKEMPNYLELMLSNGTHIVLCNDWKGRDDVARFEEVMNIPFSLKHGREPVRNTEFENMLNMKKILDQLFEGEKADNNWHVEIEQCCMQMYNSSRILCGREVYDPRKSE